MKSRQSLIRLRRFQVEEKQRQVNEIEMMMRDLQQKQFDLHEQVRFEQERAGISDVTHYAYPTFAKSAKDRADNIQVTIDGLQGQYDLAKNDLAESFEELKRVELLEEKEKKAHSQFIAKREAADMDEVARNLQRRFGR
ncbi:MAG: flagellar FliJ family protein [OCS116 cluster bacterium]|uniref:Flagellar FliJ protein n=1 Tax=OCS116 cluster bacterium TaxID=2030921 RepID=A0A2A4YPU2_9PROT|nr:flagellar FliJ family protein [OCS116 cluster bacterium]